jgi:hypothetical protein
MSEETAAAVLWGDITSIILRLSEVISSSKYMPHCWRSPHIDKLLILYKNRENGREKEVRACSIHRRYILLF